MSEKDEKIVDFGKKIGGARKDLYFSKKSGFSKEFYEDVKQNMSVLTPVEQKNYITKGNILSKLDLETLKEKGMEASAVKYILGIRSAIGVKPNIERKFSLDEAEGISNAYAAYITFVKSMDNILSEAIEKFTSFRDVERFADEEIKDLLFLPAKKDKNIKYTDLGFLAYSMKAATETLFNRVYNKHLDNLDAVSATWEDLTKKKGTGKGKTSEEKIDFKKILIGLEHLSDIEREGVSYGFKNVDVEFVQELFSFRGGEFGNWLSQKERMEVLEFSTNALLDLGRVTGALPQDIAFDGKLSIAFGSRGKSGARAHYENGRKVINLTRMSGAGSLAHEWFHALDNHLGDQILKKDYHAEKGTLSEAHSSHFISTGTLSDLPFINEEDPQEVRDVYSKQSKLIRLSTALRFGVLDSISGEFSRSDFRPIENKIHEAEYYKDKSKKARKSYRKESYADRAKRRLAELKETKFFKDAKTLDAMMGKKKAYYSDPAEMCARAFEVYISSKLEEEGYKNDYLVLSSKKSVVYKLKGSEEEISPYPQGEERERFNKMFDSLMGTIFPHKLIIKENKILEDIVEKLTAEYNKLDEPSGEIKEKIEKMPLPAENKAPIPTRQLTLF